MKLTPVSGPGEYNCTPMTCDPGCALRVIDDLLRSRKGLPCDCVDALLDFRWLVRHRMDPEGVLKLFCKLRRSMEEQHYLGFYRLRRWLENQLEASIRIRRGEPERVVPLKIERFCIEAVHYQCLESARLPGEPLQAPRVTVRFKPLLLGSSCLPVKETAGLGDACGT